MKKLKAFGALVAALMFSACSAGVSVDNLLVPPKLDEQQNEIYQALISSTGSGISLKYPKSGDFRSAFVVRNIDSEPSDEAMVFYASDSVQTGESGLRMKVLDQYNGRWQAVYDVACMGSEVDSLSFTSIGDGDNVDIVVRYSMLNQTEKAFSVMNYADGIVEELYNSFYSCLEVVDLDLDGRNELVTVVADKVTGISTAYMFSRSGGKLRRMSQAELAGTHAEILRVTKGTGDNNMPALYIDYSRGQGQYGTDVIYCSGNSLVSPDSGVISRFSNDYTADLFCTDIDSDGYMEIPSMTPLPGYETLPKNEQLCAVQWYNVRFNSILQEHYGYYSRKYSFALMFPNRWYGIVTAVPNLLENEIIFISYSQEKGLTVDESTELMRIKIVDKGDSSAQKSVTGMTLIGANEDSLYYCYQADGYDTGKLALSMSELQDSFILL